MVTVQGDVNIAQSYGLLHASLLYIFAASESDAKSRRRQRKSFEIAEAGLPNFGAPVPLVWERTG